MTMKVSVIIPTFNRRAVLARTLPTVLAQDFDPKEFEVIVVVDGSTDGTQELLRGFKPECGFHVLESQNLGAGAARNAGLRVATGELVLFLDDDLVCGPTLLQEHCKAHTRPYAVAAHGPISVLPESSKSIIRLITEQFYDEYYREVNVDSELTYPGEVSSFSILSSLINSSIPRSALVACGGFDEEIRAAEDLELGIRLWKSGVHFRQLPSAPVTELYSKSSHDYLRRQAKAVGVGDLLTARKHPEYRKDSRQAHLAESSWWKRLRRKVVAVSPISPLPLLEIPLYAETILFENTWYRKAAISLLGICEAITQLRAAVRTQGSWRALEDEYGRKLVTLLYHHVGLLRPGTIPELTVSPGNFEKQVRWIARNGYKSVRSLDWMNWVRHGTALPEKSVLISFDDGYADLAEYAFPVLQRHGLGATVFVVTDQVGGTNRWDEAQGSGTHRCLSAQQIRFWASQGIEFAAHSRTHANLTTLSEEELDREIAGSKADLEQLLGEPVYSFAYPYGAYNDHAYGLVKKTFDMAFCADHTKEGFNYLMTDCHLLRRIEVKAIDTLLEFSWRVRWGRNPFLPIRSKLRVRSRFQRLKSLVLRRDVHSV